MICSGITLDADLNRAPEMEGQSRGFSRSWEKTRIWFEPGASNMHGAKVGLGETNEAVTWEISSVRCEEGSELCG